MKRLKKILLISLSFLLFGIAVILILNVYIFNTTRTRIHDTLEGLPEAHTVIILGASVYSDGKLSPVLQDRVDTGLKLYREKKVKRFLLSGDNRSRDYNEVLAMKNYLEKRNVPPGHIFTDPAGLNTYESMYRSRDIYEVPSAIVVTQPFHLPRTIFIAQKLGLDYTGFPADSYQYKTEASLKVRESLANVKAIYKLVLSPDPPATGNKYPVTGFPR